MIKHGPGMALCLKFVANKVHSVAPLVVKLSHATVCSRSTAKPCFKSPFLPECLANGDTSSSTNPPNTKTFVDPLSNLEQDREHKSDLDVTRFISSLIFVGEDSRTTFQLRQSSSIGPCSANLLGAQYHGTTDALQCDEISSGSYHPHEKKRPVSCSLLHSGVEFKNSSPVKREEGFSPNNAQNDERLDPLKPPTEEQLQKVLDTLADDLPRFFIRPFNYKIYHKNIIFEDNIRGKRFSGFDQYFLQAKFFYLLSHLRFMYVNLDVLKITAHPEDGTVKVRWKVSVIRIRKLLGWKLLNIRSGFSNSKETWIDGFSTYYVMGDGLVHKHIADKMMPDREQMIKKENTTKTVPVPHPLAYSDRNKI
ncbi:uncharacterized protein LOC117641392 [Thrips palmi]|uniref:Uncharacterized protein LOC117641392 n=1 Tax=Thrips palmi TaxID=161013 RepID=A0A6P8YCK2_THRPL|nr:uncharacterized protein LOC117641392 [Thrips palmi]